MKRLMILILLILPSVPWASEEGAVDIRDKMTMREFTEAGLDKLSPQELDALNKWLNSHFVEGEVSKEKTEEIDKAAEETKKEEKGFFESIFGGAEYKEYEIQKIESDYRFKINKNNFTSSSICPGYSVGDKVIFIEGRADGMCESAEFSRPDRSDSCVVFCR